MLNKVEYTIDGAHGKPIVFDVTLPATESSGVVVFCHGFKGFKDWGHFNLVAEEFVSKGFTFIKLNFSHNGTSVESPMDFVDLEAFSNNNYSKELDDLGMVLDWVEKEVHNQVYLVGHSRGGGIAILKAAEDDRIRKLVTWAAVDDFESRFPQDLERFKREGVVFIPNARTNQNMPLNYQFVENYYANEARLNIRQRITEIDIPYMIIHGTADEAVSIDCATSLHGSCEGSTIRCIEGAGHTFGATHPLEQDQLPEAAQEVVNLSIDFFKGNRAI
ncbi:MAG: alpha/beta fold hydrolase [Flavobacteriales bacterium]|nr:alpha/beta fold hydrolase [Flavobacteriales bacterium]